ncbi:hypothetical protein GCM10008015_05570 [Flavobacterium palustre]|uniref:SGNH hydrolase-type esterase domain-containing protein n=1 Tax=Flavobacterium palustre TaxID=1476463 RepID=A0ABQ1HBY8_9FLAO|nr:rhamnogalacturonan acetylesterase [Flavobacterium palustre]GGA67710.1 hypothetical protein GCM10008015_05570 [Flavobacterium palustre]
MNRIKIIVSFFLMFQMYGMDKDIESKRVVRLHTIGDSTMEEQNPNVKDQRGWVQMLPNFFNENLVLVNPAKSGTSTKSYYNGGYWERAKKAIMPGDYVLIQFGHNDEKHNGLDGEIGTVPSTTYRHYLRLYINEVRALKAYPVLCTPVVRKMFGKDHMLTRRGKHDLGEYYAEHINTSFDVKDTIALNYSVNMALVAKELNCPLIDMTSATKELVNSIGDKEAARQIYSLPNDGTHFGSNGALLFSKLFIKELRKNNLLTTYLKPEGGLITNTSVISMKDIYLGTETYRVFDLIYAAKNKKIQGKINVEAIGDFEVSTKKDIGFTKIKELLLDKDSLNDFKLHIRIIPRQTGDFKDRIKLYGPNSEVQYIELSGNVLAVPDNKPIKLFYTLSNNNKPNVDGPILGFVQDWKGLSLGKYAVLENAADNFKTTKVQHLNLTSEKWPNNEIDLVRSRYIQFGFKTSENAKVVTKSVDFFIGGGSNFRIIASTDSDFSHEIVVGEETNITSDTMKKYSYLMNQKIESGQSLYVRIYPWTNQTIKHQSISISNFTIDGMSFKNK